MPIRRRLHTFTTSSHRCAFVYLRAARQTWFVYAFHASHVTCASYDRHVTASAAWSATHG